MTPREARAKKIKQLEDQKKFSPHQKISNNFIQSEIFELNKNAIKTIFYLASILEDFNHTKDLNTIQIDLREMFKHTNLTASDVKNNLKGMQKTSITFTDEQEQVEEYITLIPRIKFHYGKNKVEIDIYSKIAKLIIEVKSNYTMINTKNLMELESKHSIRLLPILHLMSSYDKNIPKRKHYDLYELNSIFGTRYKTLYEIERKILTQAKEELDSKSKLSFEYEMQFENLGKGRPKATSIIIDVVEKKTVQGRLL